MSEIMDSEDRFDEEEDTLDAIPIDNTLAGRLRRRTAPSPRNGSM